LQARPAFAWSEAHGGRTRRGWGTSGQVITEMMEHWDTGKQPEPSFPSFEIHGSIIPPFHGSGTNQNLLKNIIFN